MKVVKEGVARLNPFGEPNHPLHSRNQKEYEDDSSFPSPHSCKEDNANGHES